VIFDQQQAEGMRHGVRLFSDASINAPEARAVDPGARRMAAA
jgi:hypothetical protein